MRELRPDLDPQFAELISRSLAKEPDRRPSAEEIARALLPSAPLRVHWPPPGLDRLHGLGWRLLLALGTTAALTIIFFGSLVFAPASPAGTVTTGTLWFAGLGASALATAAAAIAAIALAGRLALLLRWGRASRYPWPVLLDVAIDPRRDTAMLLNARGPFALISEKLRGWLLRFRRIRAAALALMVTAASVGPVGWTLGWFPRSPTGGGRLVADSEIKLLLLPPLVAVLAAVLLALPETIIRRRAHTGGELLRWRRRPLIREEQVRGWLEPTGREPALEGDPRYQWTVALLPAAFAVGIGTALLATLAATLWTTLTAARWTRAAQTAATAFVADASAWRPVTSAARRITLSSRLPGRRRALTQQARDRWYAADTALSARLRSDSATAEWLAAPRASWRLALAAGPPGSVRTALRNDSVQRWLAAWRRVARMRPAPPQWAAGEGTESGPPHFTAGGTTALARLNEAAGLLAFAEGDQPTALTRARENLAVGGLLLADPANGHLAGAVLREARAALFDIGILTGNSRLLVEAEELAAVIPSAGDRAAQHWLGAAFLMADPVDPAGLSMVADSGLPHHMRWTLLRAVADAYCDNAREVLFGVDPRRRDLLNAAGAAAADVPSTEQWVSFIERRLNEWIETPRGKTVSSRVRRRGAARLVGWLGMRGLGNRVAFCGVARASPAP
ncbi:MAG: hypothetical protein ACE5JG_08365 [Planctomycetota bacterium]